MKSTHTITRYGKTWQLSVDDAIMEHVLRMGLPCEHHMIDWIMAKAPAGGLWVDAGANVGNHSIPFSFRADVLIAIEPMPQNYELLVRNTEAYYNIAAVQAGVSDKDGTMWAKRGGTGHNCQWELTTEPTKDHAQDIAVIRIDRVVPNGTRVNLIKLDVEGMEEKALDGAWDTITTWRPEIFVEVWDRAALDRIIAKLAQVGYKLIERYGHAPTYHFSVNPYPVTYTEPAA